MPIDPSTALEFNCGLTAKNRFMLAPMTNTQSHENGELSNEEFKWLTKRAEGQFGIVMTCASHVQEVGKGFPGQLGIFSDQLSEGHNRLAKKIKEEGSLALIQLHHAGMRSPAELVGGRPLCPSDNEKTGSRALSLEEVIQLRNDFIAAAVRAQKCGYDGVEVHGAHGYILTQFLSSEINKRTDQYGGSLANRARIIFEIVDGIREQCGEDFLLGVRMSPEKFGMDIEEVKTVCQELIDDHSIDFLDVSLWDCFKKSDDTKYQDLTLLEHFTSLNLNHVRLTVAGKIRSAEDVNKISEAGVDFVSIGRSAILHHDFPKRVMEDPNFKPVETPVTEEYLSSEGLSPKFVTYMRRWPGFVKD